MNSINPLDLTLSLQKAMKIKFSNEAIGNVVHTYFDALVANYTTFINVDEHRANIQLSAGVKIVKSIVSSLTKHDPAGIGGNKDFADLDRFISATFNELQEVKTGQTFTRKVNAL